MSYEAFKQRVNALIARVEGVGVEFDNDQDAGKYLAFCSDGTTIIGCKSMLKVTVLFGSGHQAMATI